MSKAAVSLLPAYVLAKLMTLPRERAGEIAAALSFDHIAPALIAYDVEPPKTAEEFQKVFTDIVDYGRRREFGGMMAGFRALARVLVDQVEQAALGNMDGPSALWDQLSSAVGELNSVAVGDLVAMAGGALSFAAGGPQTSGANYARIMAHGRYDGWFDEFATWMLAQYRPPVPIHQRGGSVIDLGRAGRIDEIVATLKTDGYYVFEEKLPPELVDALVQLSVSAPGRQLRDDQYAVGPLVWDDPTLDAFKINVDALLHSPAVQHLISDMSFVKIAQSYFGSVPAFGQPLMWWSLPSRRDATSELAQQFHFDCDYFKQLKFFFYLTDVDENAGPHVYVRGSHRPKTRPQDMLNRGYVRISDAEISQTYPADAIRTLTAPRGSIIVGDTRCWHKGNHPRLSPRLLMYLSFGNTFLCAAENNDHRLRPGDDRRFIDAVNAYPGIFSHFF